MAKRIPKNNHGAESKIVRDIDALAEFEAFRNAIPARVRRDLVSGKSADEIFKKYAPMAAAQIVTSAATSKSTREIISASKDIVDRSQGKATERKEITHKYDKCTNEELDSIILSGGADIGILEAKANEDPDTIQ